MSEMAPKTVRRMFVPTNQGPTNILGRTDLHIDNFHFVEPFVGMEIISDAGTVIANDGDLEIKTPYNNCLLMMPNHRPGAGVRKLRLCRRV